MPNWDDEFDFDDIDEPKKASNKNIKKKKNDQQDDFFDLQDKKQSKSILPNINPRQSAKVEDKNKSTKQNKINPYADKNLGSNNKYQNDYDEEFYQDLDQSPKQNDNKNKNKIQSNKIQSKSHMINNKSNITDEYNQELYQQDLEEIQQQKPKHIAKNNNLKLNNDSKTNKNNISLNIESQTSPVVKKNYILNTPINNLITNHKKQQNKKQKEEEEEDENYEEQFDNNQYNNDDFQQEQNKLPSKKQIKNNLSSNQKLNNINNPKTNNLTNPKTNNLTNANQDNKNKKLQIPPKPSNTQTNNQQRKNPKMTTVSNKNINKIQSVSVNKPLIRASSRKSIRSTDSKQIQRSRLTTKNQSQYFPNKHSDMVQKSFPYDQTQINKLSQTDINKINQKMRAMIRKFNEELNDLINKNMLLLKNKNNQKKVTIDERIKQLQIQKKTGQTSIDVMQKQFEKLQGRQGQLKQEEYQLILQKRIQQQKQKIKQLHKQITQIKREVDSKGKKLSVKEQQKKDAQSIHHLKTILIQTKKDQEKAEQRINKLTNNQQELQTKLADLQYKLDELISQAKQKGISTENQTNLIKKYQQNKKKLQNVKNFNKKTQGLISTKIDIISHQNQQIRITIKNITSQINNLYGSIGHSLNQSIKIIQKAKQKSGINPLFADNLDKLMRQIKQSKANSDYHQTRSEKRADSAKKQKRSSNHQNMDKSMPLRVSISQNKSIQQQEISIAKPKFTKKKNGQDAILQIQNKQANQRIWNEQEKTPKNNTPKVNNVIEKIKQQQKQILPTKNEQQHAVIQQKKDKSKPFSLRKNKQQNKSDNQVPVQIKIQEKPKQQPLIIEQQKKQQTINIAPRMMKFNRKKNQQNKNDISQTSNDNNAYQGIKLQHAQNDKKISLGDQPVKLQIKQQKTEQLVFAPKRFNLRNRASQKRNDSYMPSVQQTQKINSNVKQQQKQQEYKPKFDFKNQQFTAVKPKQQFKINQQIKPSVQTQSQQTDIKPKFNLRLRDKMKKNQTYQTDSYNPTTLNSNKNINDQNKYQQSLNINNPYAPKKFNLPSNINNESDTINIKPNNQLTNTNNQITNNTTAVNNPYAQKSNQINSSTKTNTQTINEPVNNPYAPKQSINNPYMPSNNPLKAERAGPLKKNKLQSNNIPKQKINIYDQAEDITNQVNEFGTTKPPNNTVQQNNNPYAPSNLHSKQQEPDLNAMLGIKKQKKKNDFDDLLGDVGDFGKKNKKKNQDFFGDLDL